MLGTEYFSTTAQPRDHIPEFCQSTPCGNHTITHFRALIRLSTTAHNLFTFNRSKISSNNSQKLMLSSDKHLYTFILHVLFKFPDVRSHGRQTSIDLVFTPEKKSWPASKFTCIFALVQEIWPLETCFRGKRLSGHPRKVNNIVPFCLTRPGSGRSCLVKWNENTIRYWTMQTLRIVLTSSHLRALHVALWESFLKVTNNEI